MEFWTVVAWVALALLSGVIGNAAWEAIRPPINSSRDWVWRAITLNAQKSRDRLYARAAKRDLNDTSVSMYQGLLAAAGVFLFLATVTAVLGAVMPDLEGKTLAEYFGWPHQIGTFSILLVAAANAYLVVLIVRLIATHGQLAFVIATFDQALSQLGPVLSSADEKDLRRQFACMSCESDYSALWLRIRELSDREGLPLTM